MARFIFSPRSVRFFVLIIMLPFITFPGNHNANATQIDSLHIACKNHEQTTLGAVDLNCVVEQDWNDTYPKYRIQVSRDNKKWIDAKDSYRNYAVENGHCGESWSVTPLIEAKSVECLYFSVNYEPDSVGALHLRMQVIIGNAVYVSNSVDYTVDEALIAEQEEAHAIDARNKSYSLSVKWPNKIPVGIPYKLQVVSKDRYSGVCAIRNIYGSLIKYETFTMKNGAGKVNLRGLKVGGSHIAISCRQQSGPGPYASASGDVYFSQ